MKGKRKIILYVFNSAYSPLYQRNLLKTLALPKDCINFVRYTIGQNVPSYFNKTPEELKKEYDGMKGLFIFVDRFATGGYKYYPVRKIKITDFNKDAGKLFIYFQVKEYCYCDTSNIDSFNTQLRDLIGDSGPKLTDNDPTSEADGNYCVTGSDIFMETRNVMEGNYWPHIITQISITPAYNQFNGDVDYLYVKINGIYHEKDKLISPKVAKDGRSFYYNLQRGSKYLIVGSYKYPYKPYKQNTIDFDFDPEAISFEEREPKIIFSGSGDRFEQRFCVKKHPEKVDTVIKLEAKTKLVYPNVEFRIQIKEQMKMILATFILFVGIGFFEYSQGRYPYLNWLLIPLKYLGFFGLFKIFGKRPI